MKLATEYFDKIEAGTKSIECRLYDEKRQQIKIGDNIEFSDAQDGKRKVMSEVVALHQFRSFGDLFKRFSVVALGGNTKDEVFSALRKFYSPEDEEKYGVVGIEIKLV
ncbi:MAG TPA: ASCH domain-containing protein [Candidatus Paceibacterota bacterium]|jgi:ASC-1-like (ASCH) protein|nr:ASCH domain-containing protein [Candidatus Paceibacterota bacterium]